MLFELINAILTNRPLNEDVFSGVSEEDWKECYDMAWSQGVQAMTFSAIATLPKEKCPPFELWTQWMGYSLQLEDQSKHKYKIVKIIGSWLEEEDLSTMIIKGFSISALYPAFNLREFGDIDIFSGKEYEAVNSCFAKHGVEVESVDGHHAYLTVGGISVEHHFAFSNTKVENGLVCPEEVLQRLALNDRQATDIPCIYYPNSVFTAAFVGWHAYEHFIAEKIQLRHIIDWALSLRQLSESEAELLGEVKGVTKWGKFTDVMTAIALHKLRLPSDWFPPTELFKADKISPELERKVLDDTLNEPFTAMSKNATCRRFHIAMRMLKNSWKCDEFADISSWKLLWKQFIGHIRHLN